MKILFFTEVRTFRSEAVGACKFCIGFKPGEIIFIGTKIKIIPREIWSENKKKIV